MLHALTGLVTSTYTTTSSGGAAAGLLVFYVVFYFVFCLPLMGIFRKAKQPAWAAFVPIYNIYIMLKMVGRPGWWLILFFIPFVNIVIGIIVYNDLSKSFGHGPGFTVGLVLLNWIFLMILWLGQSTYRGPSAGMAMGGGYPPQQPGGYPQQPGGYPQQPGGYPQQPGGYPQQPGGYPQYPQQPGAQQPGAYPPQAGAYPQQPPAQPGPDAGSSAPPFYPPPTPPAPPTPG